MPQIVVRLDESVNVVSSRVKREYFFEGKNFSTFRLSLQNGKTCQDPQIEGRLHKSDLLKIHSTSARAAVDQWDPIGEGTEKTNIKP